MGNKMNAQIRRQLLSTASAVALLASACGIGQAQAESDDSGRPVIWLEGGWHFAQLSGQGDVFAPAFATSTPRPDFETISILAVQNRPIFSYGADGKISFQPEDSDWVFSASFNYGRAHGRKNTHQETAVVTAIPCHVGTVATGLTCHRYTPREADSGASSSETHMIADFQVGKDLGLGMLGSGVASTLGFGVRFAQAKSQSATHIDEIPDFVFPTNVKYPAHHHRNITSEQAERRFIGLGPSIAWNASAPLAGALQDGQLTLDWGVNAALLFGRQRMKGHHQTTNSYMKTGIFQYPKYHRSNIYNSGNPDRSRSVVVPNLGGFAGVSWRYSDAKISLGYRADFFFGAMDVGIDARKSGTLGFKGPYASVSVGIGD